MQPSSPPHRSHRINNETKNDRVECHAGFQWQDGIRDGRGQRHRLCALRGICPSRYENRARRHRKRGIGRRCQSPPEKRRGCARRDLRCRRCGKRRPGGRGGVRGVRQCPRAVQQCRGRRWRWHRCNLARQLALGDRRQPDGCPARHSRLPPASARPWRRRPYRQYRVDGWLRKRAGIQPLFREQIRRGRHVRGTEDGA
jgi:hypothetical protein